MKKLSILVAVVAMIALMTTSAFAAPADYFAFDATEVAYTGENVTVTFKYTGSDFSFNRGGTVQLYYDSANWEIVEAVGAADVTPSWDASTGIAKWTLPASGGPFTVTEDILTLTFSLKDGGVAENSTIVSYKSANVRLASGTQLARAAETSDMAVTVKAAPAETLTEATYVNADTKELTLISPATGKETTYTNVPVFKGSAAGNFKLRAAYGDDQTHDLNNGETFDVKNFTTVNNGGLEFQVAIVGVPKDITITTLYVVE